MNISTSNSVTKYLQENFNRIAEIAKSTDRDLVISEIISTVNKKDLTHLIKHCYTMQNEIGCSIMKSAYAFLRNCTLDYIDNLISE
jgi:hypothetical protein